MADEYVHKISSRYLQKMAEIWHKTCQKQALFNNFGTLPWFSEFYFLTDFDVSKSVLGSFFAFFAKIWPKIMYRNSKSRFFFAWTTPLKNRWICPKYIPKCSVGSTDHVCKFLPKKYCVMWKILMLEISAKKGLCYVICGSNEKLRIWQRFFHAILALQIRFCLLFKRPTNMQGWQN